MAYEQRIICDRAGTHPRRAATIFSMAWCWMHFPKPSGNRSAWPAKSPRKMAYARRGAVRDAITVLDENAIADQADALWKALVRRTGRRVCGTAPSVGAIAGVIWPMR